MLKNPLHILVILSFLATLAAAFFTFKSAVLTKREMPQNEEKELALLESEKSKKENPSFVLEQITINLSQASNSERIKYLQLDAHLVATNEEAIATLEENKYILTDSFTLIASRMSPEELNSISGKILLESRVKRAINEKLGNKGLIKEILFQNFIIQ